ncbi:helix-turn-helix domain-containing protein [Streptomyces sp. NRRL F-5123]|uniref:helix-turn-helix domain-containing protein n=1 Tax=Streptomyces sp. NRRL F-5123 TaxID=1463856 RepID=UPI000ACCF1E4|nr:helix-turn-helix transcriptional regulator [Streptomyces sp. NRRL F-5123]
MTANMTSGGTFAGGGEPEPSDSLKTFGAVVMALREFSGLSREELGAHVGLSQHTVASIEQGRRMPDPDFAERAEPHLGGTGVLRKALRHVARQPGLASWFRQWARKEQIAVNLDTYECRVVPGLLQTEAYARALFEDRLPPLSDEEIDTQWVARAERQQLLSDRPNTAFSFILDEHIFRRQTGGREATIELIDHVVQLSRQRNIAIQLLPENTGVHPGLDGPVRLLETPENQWLAYSEGQETGQLITDPKVVSILRQRYAKLRTQALTPEESRGLLLRLRGEL